MILIDLLGIHVDHVHRDPSRQDQGPDQGLDLVRYRCPGHARDLDQCLAHIRGAIVVLHEGGRPIDILTGHREGIDERHENKRKN